MGGGGPRTAAHTFPVDGSTVKPSGKPARESG
eukprot:CAMPEP_0198359504 /NCGR_PEP_ID=MMETSP1450-20131203/134821_1 /TAXON_ID=753684 ORGANISM="Madagascaria erythrocladiodes, Strain CCMP3234" /NCGR_SAMPLE_ID=MMETSP1450 /ASSEMBLY_ACC=CAM_ASM_001115 /LENGTH=31 /DNA_ID= /DNA_START= /DNA_END= /DNA_ORIENTATION=